MSDKPVGEEVSKNGRRRTYGLSRRLEAERRERERAAEQASGQSPGRDNNGPGREPRSSKVLVRGYVPVTIYLADAVIHENVEESVEAWLAEAGISIRTRGKPVVGSWFRRMGARLNRAALTPAGREAILTAVHVADSHLIQSQDAYVTAMLLQNVGPVLQSLQPTKDAVVRAGALLIVKVDWVVQVHQLTAAQQAILDHQPKLAASPTEIIAALQLQDPDIQETAMQPSQGVTMAAGRIAQRPTETETETTNG